MRFQDRWKELLRPYYLRWIFFPLAPGAKPVSFQRCWERPHWRLDSPDSASGVLKNFVERTEGLDVVIYPMTDWHTRIQRSQQLARAFAALGHRVIYVNPHLGRQFDTVPLFDREHRVAQLDDNIVELHVRLPREPVFHHRRLAPGEVQIVANAMRELLGRIGSRRAFQLVSFPVWMQSAELLRRQRGFPILYDCHDLLEGFSNVAPELLAAEAEALRQADVLIFSSRFLADWWLRREPQLESRMLLARNAVDAEGLRGRAPAPGAREPGTGGYVGAIEGWFDAEAVEAMVRDNPECRILIAGRIENPAVLSLRRYPNLELTGEVSQAQLPEFLNRLRVGLIPFKTNDLTRAANPIKLYEYFSFGLPVVSSRLPEVEAYGELVYLASTPHEFAAQFRRAVSEDDERLRSQRIAVAGRESWRARAEAILQAVAALHANP